MTFSKFTCCATITSSFKTFSITIQVDPVLIKQSLPIPSPYCKPLETTYLVSVSMDLPIPDISYKHDHTLCGLL